MIVVNIFQSKSKYERSNIYQQNSCGFFIRESQGDLKIDILNWDTFSRLSTRNSRENVITSLEHDSRMDLNEVHR